MKLFKSSSQVSHESERGLRVNGLTVFRGDRSEPTVSNIDLEVEPGKVLSLVGPSGSGKTTLVQAIAGLLKASSGSISIDSHDISFCPIDRRPSGYVSQDPTLFENMTVWQNVAYGLDDPAIPDRKYRDMIDIALAEMNISGIAQAKPPQLSGGQRQRVALARTLVRRPRLLLLDEPLTHVDDAIRKVIRKDILLQIQRLNIAAIYVTHDVDEACALGDSVAVMNAGKIVQCANPQQVYEQPNSRFVARFMGIPNIVDVCTDPNSPENGVLLGHKKCIFPGHTHAEKSALCIPAERIRITSAEQASTGTSAKLSTSPSNPHPSASVSAPSTSANSSNLARLTGKIINRYFVRSYYQYEVETEVGTLVVHEVSHHGAKRIGDVVHLDIEYGWRVPHEEFGE
ncbi:iron(III) transport system ATP-binding protein/putative spermidine/putrescine transport system ATP-binding protein [Arcanobacterium pluranimalium]|uniref:ABC transporter ATP-binding protein n=1 Tax=Arcanobacterium pluranimalium TaxID=108028 RepID=UPI00195DD8D2|nr:ABC transporter ATP-binding protein [Arcanobacterium pluranimalium]MBM7825011.1 iron(III) transport system ATP-binding protein/putative spermidine/putrescine transport system ATP-binding protein [Arcanobacterium pluranimalium]